jgi:hypothetical protein
MSIHQSRRQFPAASQTPTRFTVVLTDERKKLADQFMSGPMGML